MSHKAKSIFNKMSVLLMLLAINLFASSFITHKPSKVITGGTSVQLQSKNQSNWFSFETKAIDKVCVFEFDIENEENDDDDDSLHSFAFLKQQSQLFCTKLNSNCTLDGKLYCKAFIPSKTKGFYILYKNSKVFS